MEMQPEIIFTYLTFVIEYFSYSFQQFFRRYVPVLQLTFPERMKMQLDKYNSKKAHSFRGNIVILKSRPLLELFSKQTNDIPVMSSLHEKMLAVCSELYGLYDPRMIYTFNDEIHLVYMYNDYGHQLFNGNIHKILTHLTSTVTYLLGKEQLLDVRPEVTAKFVQFNEDYDILNFIKWKQSHCLSRAKLLYENLEIVPDWLKFGTFLKKKIILKTNCMTREETTEFDYTSVDPLDLVVRKKLSCLEKNLYQENSDFKDDFEQLVCRKFLFENPESLEYLSAFMSEL